MDVVIEDRAKVWRDRGRPPRELPAAIVEIATNIYGTGKVLTLAPVTPEEKAEAAEILRMLRTAARRANRYLRIQRQKGVILCEIVDLPPGSASAKKGRR